MREFLQGKCVYDVTPLWRSHSPQNLFVFEGAAPKFPLPREQRCVESSEPGSELWKWFHFDDSFTATVPEICPGLPHQAYRFIHKSWSACQRSAGWLRAVQFNLIGCKVSGSALGTAGFQKLRLVMTEGKNIIPLPLSCNRSRKEWSVRTGVPFAGKT